MPVRIRGAAGNAVAGWDVPVFRPESFERSNASPEAAAPVVIRVHQFAGSWRVDLAETDLHSEHDCESDATEIARWVGRSFWLATGRGCLVVLDRDGMARRTLAHYQLSTEGSSLLPS